MSIIATVIVKSMLVVALSAVAAVLHWAARRYLPRDLANILTRQRG